MGSPLLLTLLALGIRQVCANATNLRCVLSNSLANSLRDGCICYPCSICVFRFSHGCDIAAAVSTATGWELPTRRPMLAAIDWFLPTQSTSFSLGNHVATRQFDWRKDSDTWIVVGATLPMPRQHEPFTNRSVYGLIYNDSATTRARLAELAAQNTTVALTVNSSCDEALQDVAVVYSVDGSHGIAYLGGISNSSRAALDVGVELSGDRVVCDVLTILRVQWPAMRLPEPPISVCKSEKKGSVAVQLVTDLALDARVTAIRRATNYIYIEASLMSLVPAVFRALQDTLPTIQRLIIVTPTLAPWAVAAGFEKYRYDLLAPLYAAFPSKMSVYTLRATPLHSNVLLIDDVFVAIGATDWTFRRPTRSPLNVHLVDAATTIADDGVRVTHFARMFRLARFAALTGGVMSFNMSFLDAADALQTYAATHIFGVIVPAPPVYKYYFARYNDATQAAFEGHAPCQRSDDALVSIACVCRGVALDRCPELLAYADGPGALVEAQMDAAQLHTAITVLGGMLVATLVLLCVLVTCCRRWLRRRHSRRRITAILNEALRPHQRLPST